MATVKFDSDNYKTMRMVAREGGPGALAAFDAVTAEVVAMAANYGDNWTVTAFGRPTVLDGLPSGSFTVVLQDDQGRTMSGGAVLDVDSIGPRWRICF